MGWLKHAEDAIAAIRELAEAVRELTAELKARRHVSRVE